MKNKLLASHKIFILVLFLIISVFSECLYIFNNKPQLFGLFFIWKSQRLINRDFQKAIGYAARAAETNIIFTRKKYPDLISRQYKPNFKQLGDSKFQTETENYIEKLDLKHIASSEEIELSRIFYTLGLVSFQSGFENEFPAYLQTAVYLSPELSHYHIELANYYHYSNEINKTKESIDFCFNFKNPLKECQNYKNSLINNDPKIPGFLQSEVDKYYSSKVN